MSYIKYIIFFALISLLIFCDKEQSEVVVPKQHKVDEAEQVLLDVSNDLGFRCFTALNRNQPDGKNLIVSPINAALSFNLLLQAADDGTERIIKQFFRVSQMNDSNITDGFDKLNKLFSEIDVNTSLVTSNVIAVDEGLNIEPEFNKFINKRSHTKIVKDNNAGFVSINNYKETSPEAFQLINSINFNAQLKYQKRIEELPFYKSPYESNFVQMVVAESQFNYYSDPAIKAVELPLGRGNFNILLIVPQGTHNLKDIVQKMDKRLLNRIKSKFKPHSMEVYLPVLELSEVESYRNIFKNGRLGNCFNSRRANFSKLSNERSCYMSDIEQVIGFSLGKPDNNFTSTSENIADNKTSFLIDHPFIFVVYEKYSEAVMFIGKVSNL